MPSYSHSPPLLACLVDNRSLLVGFRFGHNESTVYTRGLRRISVVRMRIGYTCDDDVVPLIDVVHAIVVAAKVQSDCAA